jgi:hypothetical protein
MRDGEVILELAGHAGLAEFRVQEGTVKEFRAMGCLLVVVETKGGRRKRFIVEAY